MRQYDEPRFALPYRLPRDDGRCVCTVDLFATVDLRVPRRAEKRVRFEPCLHLRAAGEGSITDVHLRVR